eukprot:1161544-Pelagomonas_calceolata.AAC.1
MAGAGDGGGSCKVEGAACEAPAGVAAGCGWVGKAAAAGAEASAAAGWGGEGGAPDAVGRLVASPWVCWWATVWDVGGQASGLVASLSVTEFEGTA